MWERAVRTTVAQKFSKDLIGVLFTAPAELDFNDPEWGFQEMPAFATWCANHIDMYNPRKRPTHVSTSIFGEVLRVTQHQVLNYSLVITGGPSQNPIECTRHKSCLWIVPMTYQTVTMMMTSDMTTGQKSSTVLDRRSAHRPNCSRTSPLSVAFLLHRHSPTFDLRAEISWLSWSSWTSVGITWRRERGESVVSIRFLFTFHFFKNPCHWARFVFGC